MAAPPSEQTIRQCIEEFTKRTQDHLNAMPYFLERNIPHQGGTKLHIHHAKRFARIQIPTPSGYRGVRNFACVEYKTGKIFTCGADGQVSAHVRECANVLDDDFGTSCLMADFPAISRGKGDKGDEKSIE